MTILITGANGNIASETIQHLRSAGKAVRAMVRDEAKAGPPRSIGDFYGEVLAPAMQADA